MTNTTDKLKLITLSCPTCGASLKVDDTVESVECVYCGNTFVPVKEASATVKNDTAMGMSSVVKVEGIRTPSSGLAYMEQFFDEYDWETFSYAQTLSVSEMDQLAATLKVTSADDKNTWFVCFKSISVPFVKKIEGCKEILASVIEEYKKDNLDAYSKFDAYKRIAYMILSESDDVVEDLEKITVNANKYGATSVEIEELNSEIRNIKNISNINVYDDIESIPEIVTFIKEKDAKIVSELAKEGIDADSQYVRAKALIEDEQYVEAMHILCALKGYADTKFWIQKIDKYYRISNVLEMEGKLYYFKENELEKTFSILPTEDGKISDQELVENVKRILINYADVIYFIDDNSCLKKYQFSTNTEDKIFDRTLKEDWKHVYGRKVYLLAEREGEELEKASGENLIELDSASGEVRTVLEGVKEILSFSGNKLIYQVSDVDEESHLTNIINVDTMDIIELGKKSLSIIGYVDDYVVYMQESPNRYNKNLYIKSLSSDEPEKLIEKNIFQFFKIIGNKLFYYVGNSSNKTLVYINYDGTERKEWPLYISDVWFEQGGWLYFTRKSGYNSILCKSRLDGTKFSVIAADVAEFVDIKNGYLYYIDDIETLIKVRMDGSNFQELCEDVETVLSVKEDKIIFVSIDDKIKSDDFSSPKIVKSIYVVDFNGSGRKKLAYNINAAKEYDESSVYYIAAEEITSSYEQLDAYRDVLYKLDVETNHVEKIVDLEIKEKESKISGFIIAMVIMGIAFFLALIGFSAGAAGFGAICLCAGMAAGIIGLAIKLDRKSKNENS